jgi:hypothetical protein
MQQLYPRATFRGLMVLPPRRSLSGFGATTQQLAASGLTAGAGAAAAYAATTAALSSAAAAGTTASLASLAIPWVGPAIAIATLAIALIENSGCGQTCIVSTQFANQADAAMQQNIQAYFGQPIRYASSQQAALANFDHFWAWLQTQCSNSQLGTAGQRCISDRQAGACTWKQPAASVPPWGTPAAGACWNWFNGYRDPIANDHAGMLGANDPGPQPDPVAGSTSGASATGTGTNPPAPGSSSATTSLLSSPLLLVGAGLLALAVLGGDN